MAFFSVPPDPDHFPDNVNLSSIRDFLGFASDNFTGKDNIDVCVGVDATEGKTWCGYGQAGSITINHTVLARLDRHSVKARCKSFCAIEKH